MRSENSNKEKLIYRFPKNIELDASEFYFFKYGNGEYFFGLLPERWKSYNNTIIHLDTMTWKSKEVQLYGKNDKNYILPKSGKNYSVYGPSHGAMSSFLDDFQIVKVNNEFKLKMKNKELQDAYR